MAITAPRIIGRDITITIDGVKTIWDTLSVSEGSDTEDATASDSTENEVVRTTKLLECTLTGFQGSENNAGTLPQDGDVISDLAVAIGADSLLPVISGYTNIKVLKPSYDFAKGPAKFSFTFRNGVLN